jgi:dTDP-4-dehydrorhamnose 3,5-epimerase
MKFEINKFAIPESFIIKRTKFLDIRGEFSRLYDDIQLTPNCVNTLKNINYSFNATKGTFRGFHGAIAPFQETKIVMPITGSLLDILLEECPDGTIKYHTVTLDSRDGTALIVPKHSLNAFITLEDNTSLLYLTDNNYSPEGERGARFNDPKINLPEEIISNITVISEKDKSWMDL